MEIRPAGAEFLSDGRADKLDEANRRFSKFFECTWTLTELQRTRHLDRTRDRLCIREIPASDLGQDNRYTDSDVLW